MENASTSGDPIIYRSAPWFLQGPGLIDSLGERLRELCRGGRACLLLDPGVRFLRPRLAASLAAGGVPATIHEFDGDLSLRHVDELAARLQAEERPAVYVGVGSGKAIDLSKMLARRSGARNAVVATASATDAAPSHAAVGVDERGHIQAESCRRAPDLVLVDSAVIAAAPVRLFVAGIGDAVSKRFELETAAALGEPNAFGGRRPFFISPLAEVLHRTLLEKGRPAAASVAQGRLNEAVEEVITACVLLSTLVWENGGLAGAHSIANVLFNGGDCRGSLHGEQVAFGLLVQLAVQGREADLRAHRAFYREIGLPDRASALEPALAERERVSALAEGIHQRWKKHRLEFPPGRILEAILELERG